VTIKYDKGHDSTWAVFRGETVLVLRDQIVEFFNIDKEFAASLTLHELTQNATQQAHGVATAVRGLGGTVVPAQRTATKTDEAQTGGDAWAQAEAGAAKEGEDPLAFYYAGVEAATSRPELKKFWAENQQAFEDEALMAAYKAKGKALPA
jgi:hypothetical protein